MGVLSAAAAAAATAVELGRDAQAALQARSQTFGDAMFFMNDAALKQMDKAEGFEVGVGPSAIAVDEGMTKTTATTTMKDDIDAFIFGRKGLMAGLGVQGNKITKIHPRLPATDPQSTSTSTIGTYACSGTSASAF